LGENIESASSGESTLKKLLEALLFVTDKPITVAQMKDVCSATNDAIKKALEGLRKDCESQDRGVQLKTIAGGYQFVTDTALAEDVKRFFRMREKRRVSQASLETLSIVAYRQPVTRAEIEFIRGVNVDGALKTLLEKGLIRITGRKEVAGRPILYGTTSDFLDHFGLENIKDLPKLAEFSEKDIELPDSLKERLMEEGEHGAETVTEEAK